MRYYLNPTEAARILYVTRPTVYAMLKDGRLTVAGRTPSGRLQLDPVEVDALAGTPGRYLACRAAASLTRAHPRLTRGIERAAVNRGQFVDNVRYAAYECRSLGVTDPALNIAADVLESIL